LALLGTGSAYAADAPMVPPAAPGVFSAQDKTPDRVLLTVAAHKFVSRADAEKYLAYRAAELTLTRKASWFILIEARAPGDTVPVPKVDPNGLHYSFRMAYWRPLWRYRLAGDKAWKTWSPFSGAAFFADGRDVRTITDYEVSADIKLRKGRMDDLNPLAFEARAVSDLMVNQVSPPT
jgi:hypothetical protein